MSWVVQKVCKDIGEYELIAERQKRDWECEQKSESWKWSVVYHGSVVASGSVNSIEEAKKTAAANVPENADENAGDCS